MSGRAGRPRDAEADRKISEAVIELLSEEGYSATTIDAVARRAQVSRPTIYRRYADRTALVHAVLARLVSEAEEELAPRADPFDHVVDHLTATIDMLTQTPVGRIFRVAIAQAPHDAELAALMGAFGRQRRERLVPAVEAAIAADVLRTQPDVEVMVDALIGAIYFRFLMTNRALNEDYARALLSTFA